MRILTFAVLIDAITAVPAALMTREFMQRERMIVDTVGFGVGFAAAIVMAMLGAGAWALVASALLGNVVNALFILRYAPKRYPYGWDLGIAKELLAFGLPLAVASLMMIAMLNIDYVVDRRGARPAPARLLPAGLQPLRLAGEHVLGPGAAHLPAALRPRCTPARRRPPRPSSRCAPRCCS